MAHRRRFQSDALSKLDLERRNMFRKLMGVIVAAAAMTLAASAAALAEAPPGPPITIGFSMPLTGGLAVNGTSGLLAMQIWAEDTNQKGGAARPPSQACLLRRPDQPVLGAWDLHEAARCRQGRPRRFRLRHQCHRTGITGGDPAQQDVHRSLRDGRRRGVSLPEILLDAAGR